MQKLFVYGTLKRGNRLHEILMEYNCRFLDEGYTQQKYSLYRVPFGYPVMLEEKRHHVKGELFDVPIKLFKYLDVIEGSYNRRSVPIIAVNLRQTGFTTAWAYIGKPEMWGDPSDGRLPLCEVSYDPIQHAVWHP